MRLSRAGAAALVLAVMVAAGAACSLVAGLGEYEAAPGDGGAGAADASGAADGGDATPGSDAEVPACPSDDAGQCGFDPNHDPHNCGACGHDCLGLGCDGSGHCNPQLLTRLDAGGGFIQLTAIDGTYAYWTDGSDVGRTALDGSSTEIFPVLEFVDGGLGPISEVIPEPDALYAIAINGLYAIPTDGGAFRTVTNGFFYEGNTTSLTQFSIYQGTAYLAGGSPTSVIDSVPIAASNAVPNTVIGTQSDWEGVLVDPTPPAIYWAEKPPGDGGLARILSFGLADGGGLGEPTSGSPNPNLFATDDTFIYWTDNLSGSVYRVAKTGDAGAPAEQIVQIANPGDAGTIETNFIALSADGNVYFNWYDTATVQDHLMRVSRCGGTPAYVVNPIDYQQVFGIAVDSTYVYFGAGNQLYRVPK